MSASNYQAWMAVIGVWLAVTLLGVGQFTTTGSTESALFTVLFGVVTLVNVVYAVLDLSGAAGE